MALLLWSTLRSVVLICLVTLVTGIGVRLHGGSSDDRGFVQINVDGEWKIICNDDWDALDALVVCRELGFTEGYAIPLRDQETIHEVDYWDNGLGTVSTVIKVTEAPNFQLGGNNFACNGTETSLLSCKYNREFTGYCSTPARMACGVNDAKFKELLTNLHDYDDDNGYSLAYFISDNSSGRVLAMSRLYNYSSEYSEVLSGGICNINERAARLICQDYGYINGGTPIQVPSISNLPMLLSDLSCAVGTNDIYYCRKVFTDDGICPDGVQFNGVKCFVKGSGVDDMGSVQINVRLHGGSSDDRGFVQINVDGEWKIICNEDWDALDALVVCRELGFTNGYATLLGDTILHEYVYEKVTEAPNFKLRGNNFACNGTETSLLSCKYNREFTGYCSTPARMACGANDAKVKELLTNLHGNRYYLDYLIQDNSNGRVLATPQSNYGSDIEILPGGICNINERAARLICKDSGYINGGTPIQVPTIPNLPMLLSELSCSGEDDLYYCGRVVTNDGICPDDVQFNGVKCYTSLTPSVIGALAFAGVSCIFLIIAGAVGIHRIRRKAYKTSNSESINLTIGDQSDTTPRQPLQQSA